MAFKSSFSYKYILDTIANIKHYYDVIFGQRITLLKSTPEITIFCLKTLTSSKVLAKKVWGNFVKFIMTASFFARVYLVKVIVEKILRGVDQNKNMKILSLFFSCQHR